MSTKINEERVMREKGRVMNLCERDFGRQTVAW